MSSFLQQQIQTRMQAKKLSIYALEKEAGLKRGAARNILHGFSKKPSAEALKAIAKVLDCRVDDLVSDIDDNYVSSPIVKVTMPSKSGHQWNEKLCLDAIRSVSTALSNKKLELKYEQIMALASEAYKYSLGKQSDNIDEDFVSWLINKNF